MNSVEGRIIKAISGFYYVETTDNTYECKARGSFRKTSKTPVVGDLVTISISKSGYPTVEEIHKRKNSIVRPPMANIDTLVIVCSTVSPAPNYTVIDKMTATAVYNNIEPVIVISKSDIKSGEEIYNIYNSTGIKTILYSSVTGEGVDEIYSLLPNKITAFIGNSGVGKSHPGFQLCNLKSLIFKTKPNFNICFLNLKIISVSVSLLHVAILVKRVVLFYKW